MGSPKPAERLALRRVILVGLWVAGWSLLVATACPPSGITYVYDENLRLVAVEDPSQGTRVYGYDALGNITSINQYTPTKVLVLSFSPPCAAVGSAVAINGTGFDSTATVTFTKSGGTVAGSVTSVSFSQLVTSVPTGAITGAVTVTVGSDSGSKSFTVGCGAPTITSVASPTSRVGAAGAGVTLNGTNFAIAPGDNRVGFNGWVAQVSSVTGTTSLNTSVPSLATSGALSLATAYGTVSGPDFFVPPPPHTAADVESGGTGRALVDGTSATVTSTSTSHIALIVFDGTAGPQLEVGTSGGSGVTSNFTMFTPNGTFLFPTTFGIVNGVGNNGDAILTPPMPVDGTYTIMVSPLDTGGFGSMTVRLVTNHATLSASPSTIVVGQIPTVSWNSIGIPTAVDEVGLYSTGASDSNWVNGGNTGGTASGSNTHFGTPTCVGTTYEYRLFLGRHTRLPPMRLATSNPVTVTACTGDTLTASPTTVVRGNPVTAMWSGICSPNSSDWIQVFPQAGGTPIGSPLVNTNANASGSGPITIPAGTSPGTYVLEYLVQGLSTCPLLTSNTFTVTVQ